MGQEFRKHLTGWLWLGISQAAHAWDLLPRWLTQKVVLVAGKRVQFVFSGVSSRTVLRVAAGFPQSKRSERKLGGKCPSNERTT